MAGRSPAPATRRRSSALTRDDLVALPPDAGSGPTTPTIFVVGDLPLAELMPLLEARFGTWAAPAVPQGHQELRRRSAGAEPRIVLVDRPQSPQSMILAGVVLPVARHRRLLTLLAANEVLGGNFLSRINMDLRETKGWSYGVAAASSAARASRPLHHQRPGPGRPDRAGRSRR